MKYKVIFAVGCCLLAVGCARSSAIRTAQNEAIISTTAAPVCGDEGALKVAEKQAAIETIKAGYDRYVITGQQGQDTTHLVQMPGSYSTTGTASFSGNTGFYQANTVYQPGPTFVAGHHNQKLAVHMFKDGEPGSQNALSAKQTLGPKWADVVKDGVITCAG
jgi:hypothetical protein